MTTKYTWMEEAREIASICLGDSVNKDVVESVTRNIAAWMQTAAQNQQNTDYYRSLLGKCAELIGEEAYISYDGTKREDVLCAKIPELVEGLLNHSDDMKTESLNFGEALTMLKQSYKVARVGWNGKDMWICLTEGSVIENKYARSGAVLALANDGESSITINDHIDMKTADGSICCGWLASQADMLANDWMIVE